jgi:hypothetical protein
MIHAVITRMADNSFALKTVTSDHRRRGAALRHQTADRRIPCGRRVAHRAILVAGCEETGLKRHAAALHLARAALALNTGQPDAARAALRAALPPIEEGRCGLLPELTRLVLAGGFKAEFTADLARLDAAQAAYNAEADAQWEAHERYAAELPEKAGA